MLVYENVGTATIRIHSVTTRSGAPLVLRPRVPVDLGAPEWPADAAARAVVVLSRYVRNGEVRSLPGSRSRVGAMRPMRRAGG